jgi:hypothetical protein
MNTRPTVLALLAAILPAAARAAEAPAPDAFAELRPLIGGWSGRMICDKGNFSVGMAIDERDGKIVARYSTILIGTRAHAGGSADVNPGSKPGRFTASAESAVGKASVRISTAEKGRVLIFAPDPAATGLMALIKFTGTARLDKARTKASVRYTTITPLGSEPCAGTLTKQP